MPELPEIEVLKQRLRSAMMGRQIQQFKMLKPYVLRNVFGGDLRNENIKDVVRRGKYIIIHTDSHTIIIHLMLRGSLQHTTSAREIKKSTAAILEFTDGSSLQFIERGSEKRMSIYILPQGESMDKIDRLGVDPLTEEFTVSHLAMLLACESMQLKSFLCDQTKIAGIGNAYADEILWGAGLSPFKLTRDMNEKETSALHRSIMSVLSSAIQQLGSTGISEKRNFLKIYRRKGWPCPECGDTIRAVRYSKYDTFYCPTCQAKGKLMKDRRMSRFYR